MTTRTRVLPPIRVTEDERALLLALARRYARGSLSGLVRMLPGLLEPQHDSVWMLLVSIAADDWRVGHPSVGHRPSDRWLSRSWRAAGKPRTRAHWGEALAAELAEREAGATGPGPT